jgi:hypothetical protein
MPPVYPSKYWSWPKCRHSFAPIQTMGKTWVSQNLTCHAGQAYEHIHMSVFTNHKLQLTETGDKCANLTKFIYAPACLSTWIWTLVGEVVPPHLRLHHSPIGASHWLSFCLKVGERFTKSRTITNIGTNPNNCLVSRVLLNFDGLLGLAPIYESCLGRN